VANPVLNEKTFNAARAGSGGWAAPDPSVAYAPAGVREKTNEMTVNGTLGATAILLAILFTTGIVGWRQVHVSQGEVTSFPTWTLIGIIGAIAIAWITSSRPQIARITGPIYAALEGLIVGAISHVYNVRFHGIVVQAVGATVAVAAVMLVVQRTGIIKVTDRMRRTVMIATLGVMLFYGVSIIVHLFGASVPIINDATPIGILFSVLVAGLAAFRLLIDIDFIDRQAKAGAPKSMEWYGAFALTVTLVWLYLEILRLLSKLQSRR
jgi:uncharacterized YccA/Bax inhibitor family protein